MRAQDPPELPPMVARPSGSWVSLTWASVSTQGKDFGFDELGIVAGHGVVLEAALAALRVAAAVADGDGDHDGQFVLGDEAVERGEEHAVGAVGAHDEWGFACRGHTALGTYTVTLRV